MNINFTIFKMFKFIRNLLENSKHYKSELDTIKKYKETAKYLEKTLYGKVNIYV